MRQYTANLEPFIQRILTAAELSFLIESFDEVAASLESSRVMTGVDVPIQKSDEIRQIIKSTLSSEFPRKAKSILEGTGNEELTLDQIRIGGELADPQQRAH